MQHFFPIRADPRPSALICGYGFAVGFGLVKLSGRSR